MAYANYSALRTAVLRLIDGDDVGTTFSIDTLDSFISMGESLVYYGDQMTPGLRASSMLANLSAAVSSNAAPLPADLVQLDELHFAGEPPLEIVPLDRLRRLLDSAPAGSASRYAAQDGDSVRFWPEASGTLLGRYYKRHEPLKTGTWADQTTFARYPECFIYAALLSSAPFLGEDARIPTWDRFWRQHMAGAAHAERMRVMGGGPLRVRSR